MPTTIKAKLINFIQHELGISDSSIALAQAQAEAPNLLPIVLWQYELLDLEQLEQVLNWLETVNLLLTNNQLY